MNRGKARPLPDTAAATAQQQLYQVACGSSGVAAVARPPPSYVAAGVFAGSGSPACMWPKHMYTWSVAAVLPAVLPTGLPAQQ